MRPMVFAIAVLTLLPAAAAETWTAKCSYWQLSGASYEGPCTVTDGTNEAGAYAATVVAGDVTVKLVETARQGVWSTYSIDGQPGVRFEHNRESYSYSTLSLDMTLDVSQ